MSDYVARIANIAENLRTYFEIQNKAIAEGDTDTAMLYEDKINKAVAERDALLKVKSNSIK